MTMPNPPCLNCGGRVRAGRCRDCRRYQKTCEGERCSRPFTSVRRDARFCGPRCALNDWRARNPDRRSREREVRVHLSLALVPGRGRGVRVEELKVTATRVRPGESATRVSPS